MPWDSVLREAADNQDFWHRELMEPAIAYDRLRGSTSSPVHQVNEPIIDAVDRGVADEPPPNRQRGGRGNRTTDNSAMNAQQVCFAFSRQRNGCREPCPQGRYHGCEVCWKKGVRGIDCCKKEKTTKQGKSKGKGKRN